MPNQPSNQHQLNARQREQERVNKKYGDQDLIERAIERDAMLLFHKNKQDTIISFSGPYEFLKPEFPAKVYSQFFSQSYP